MLIIQNTRNKTFPENLNSKNELLDDCHFKQQLYRNSKVCRLIIQNYNNQSNLNTSSWYTISLQLVTEMGLPAQTSFFKSKSNQLPITCQLLTLNNNHKMSSVPFYTSPLNLNIECRLFEENDPWRQPESQDSFSFQYNNTITLQYRINSISNQLPHHLFIYFQTRNQPDFVSSPLGVCLGPFQLTQDFQPISWDDSSKNSVHLHRVANLPIKNAFSLFQEQWHNGTSGKLWDSALIMNHVFDTLFKLDKDFLSGRTLLDLSAGIGYIGLFITQLCKIYETTNPPNVVLTDLEEAIPLMKYNQALNQIPNSKRLSFKRLRWGSKKDIDSLLSKISFDYILVSDVLYNTTDFPALIDTFCQLVEKNPNSVILMGYKPRGLKQTEESLFFNECKSRLSVEQLNLISFSSEFFETLPSKASLYFTGSTLLDHTAVSLYKIKRKSYKCI